MKLRTMLMTAVGTAVTLGTYALLVPDEGDALRGRLPWMVQDPGVRAADERWRLARDEERRLGLVWEATHSLALAEALPPARASFTYTAQRGLPAHVNRHFEGRARTELAALGRAPAQPIVVRVVVDSVLGRFGYRRAVVAPTRADAPCVSIVRVGVSFEDRAIRWSADDQLLGVCGFYALYGMPGAGMARWLERTSAQSAASVVFAVGSDDAEPIAVSAREVAMAPLPMACAVGRTTACRWVFDGGFDSDFNYLRGTSRPTAAQLAERFPTVWAFAPWQATWIGGGQLAAVRAEVGDERFARIWKSAEDPGAAYAQSEGRPIETFVAAHVARTITPYSPGPMVGVFPLVFALGLTGGLAWWAIGRSARTMS